MPGSKFMNTRLFAHPCVFLTVMAAAWRELGVAQGQGQRRSESGSSSRPVSTAYSADTVWSVGGRRIRLATFIVDNASKTNTTTL